MPYLVGTCLAVLAVSLAIASTGDMLAAQLFSMFGTLLGLTGILLYIVVWDLRKKWL